MQASKQLKLLNTKFRHFLIISKNCNWRNFPNYTFFYKVYLDGSSIQI